MRNADQVSALCPRQAIQAPQQSPKKLRIYLGRDIRDMTRKIEGVQTCWARLSLACWRWRGLIKRSASPSSYALHAPGLKCIGKAHQARAKGGQFVTHVKALPGNPIAGHMLKPSFRTWRR